ncbi:MAG: alpha/beta fold hydrolase [Deltaproteobacteria bacterium]|nr:alpha/beta fold hydrolase [Deltaproteobacteria bacterium]
MRRLLLLSLPLALLGSCVDLDAFVYGGVHCSAVGPETCEDPADWNSVCLPCETPYDWSRSYDWMEGTLEAGESIRPIDPSRVTAHRIPTADGEGELDAYLIASHGDDPELAGTTLLYHHGNYAGLEHYLPRIQMLHELGYTVFAWDYRGYGKSEPATHPTPLQFLADARTVRAYVDGLVPDPDRIVLYGYSLGTIPTVEAGLADPGCAMMVEAPFTSVRQIARSSSGLALPPGFLSSGHFENSKKIEGYDGPLLVMHGGDDRLFPPEDVRAFHDAAPGPKELWTVEGADHGIDNGGVPEDGLAEYGRRMRAFLTTHAPGCFGP